MEVLTWDPRLSAGSDASSGTSLQQNFSFRLSPKGQGVRAAAYLGCQSLGVGKENMKKGKNERKKLLWNGLEEATVLAKVLLPVLVRVFASKVRCNFPNFNPNPYQMTRARK